MTSKRPARVHINELGRARFSLEMARMRAAVTPLPAQLRLERNVLLPDAAAQIGLDDFGSPDFEKRLDVLLYGTREEAGLSQFGVLTGYNLMLQLLKIRLLIQDLLKRHIRPRGSPTRGWAVRAPGCRS